MADKKYVLGPDINLDEEKVLLPDGTQLTEARAQEIAEETWQSLRGRPSLTGRKQHSPRISVRLTPEDLNTAQQLAQEQGITLSEFVRQTVEERLHQAS